MKKVQKTDFFNKTKEELMAIAKKEMRDLSTMRLYYRLKKNKNTREIFIKRKNLAVLKTIIRQKELAHG
jgi:ribosomal protein L29